MRQLGWFRSAREDSSIDADGQPIPWLTYPAISFLEQRLHSNHAVFEYGAGNSTLWLASKVGSIQSLEHTEAWANRLRPRLPANATLEVRHVDDPRHYDDLAFLGLEENNAYTRFILDTEARFDIIVIDGIYRNACVVAASQRLKSSGVLVLDNTDFSLFRPSQEFLVAQEFRAIDFVGMCPITQTLSQTSIFYKDGNCLQI